MAEDFTTGLQRITRLEVKVEALEKRFDEKIEGLQKDISHIEAWQENTSRTMSDVAGLLRDQTTERRLLNKLVHLVGWIIAAAIGWFGHKHLP